MYKNVVEIYETSDCKEVNEVLKNSWDFHDTYFN